MGILTDVVYVLVDPRVDFEGRGYNNRVHVYEPLIIKPARQHLFPML
jgi:hypothetical protein